LFCLGQVFPKDIDLSSSTKQPNYPQSFRVPPTQPLHCDTQFTGTAPPSNDDVRPKSPSNEINTVCTKTAGESADTKDADCGRTSPSESSGSLEAGVWRCGQCFKSFTQRSLLQIHVCPRLPEKPYQCGHCAQSYAHPTDLRTHVVTHNSERPFKCGFCGRSFAGSTTLNNHIRTHTGQKPFVCENCSRSFSQASQLSRHQRLTGDCCPKDNTHWRVHSVIYWEMFNIVSQKLPGDCCHRNTTCCRVNAFCTMLVKNGRFLRCDITHLGSVVYTGRIMRYNQKLLNMFFIRFEIWNSNKKDF
jgi:uncharacterized Zn-finger protein